MPLQIRRHQQRPLCWGLLATEHFSRRRKRQSIKRNSFSLYEIIRNCSTSVVNAVERHFCICNRLQFFFFKKNWIIIRFFEDLCIQCYQTDVKRTRPCQLLVHFWEGENSSLMKTTETKDEVRFCFFLPNNNSIQISSLTKKREWKS